MQSPDVGSGFEPDQWPKEDVCRYLALENTFGRPCPAVIGSKGMIAATNGPFAVHAGLEVLKHGGSAADAVLTTALAQIALFAGATISYGGILTAAYYDATAGRVHTLNAAYNTVQNEKDPLSIPGPGEPSGRTALVPGFLAGVQALHDRFGKVPFATLFGPAIWIAENGVALSPAVSQWLRVQGQFVTRLPDARRIFTKEAGELHITGDLFRQPELAITLRRIASQGSAFMYEGEWAQRFIDAVRREGGKMTLEDLAGYRVLWTEPLQISYRDYHVFSLGLPNTGGLQTLGSLKMAEAGDLPKYGHYTTSPDTLYALIHISRIQSLLAYAPSTLKQAVPNLDLSVESRLTAETAERLWSLIQNRMITGASGQSAGSNHSAGVLAVDDRGNVAAILHSCNCSLWGSTGIFVDGISIPDSAGINQTAIASAGPGARLPEGTNPLIVLKNNEPVLASVAIGAGLHQATLQNLVNILDFGMSPKTAVDQPNSRGPFLGMSLAAGPPHPEYEKEAVGEGEFSTAVLEGVHARGQAIKVVGQHDQAGHWIGIQIARESNQLIGGVTPKLNGLAEGY